MVTSHCALCRKDSLCTLVHGFCVSRKGGTGGGGWGHCRLTCTWWLLGLALKGPWLVLGGLLPTLTAWTGLENTTLTLQKVGFCERRLLGLQAGIWQAIVLTIACSLMSGCGQSYESAYYSWKWTWVQFWSQSLGRNGEKVR